LIKGAALNLSPLASLPFRVDHPQMGFHHRKRDAYGIIPQVLLFNAFLL
jgi:hypothetical protein